jgi:hypothetical protein
LFGENPPAKFPEMDLFDFARSGFGIDFDKTECRSQFSCHGAGHDRRDRENYGSTIMSPEMAGAEISSGWIRENDPMTAWRHCDRDNGDYRPHHFS